MWFFSYVILGYYQGLDYVLYSLIEIKLGEEELISEGIANLKSIEEKIKENGQHFPSFKMIITATGDAQIIDDVYIVPINMLKA